MLFFRLISNFKTMEEHSSKNINNVALPCSIDLGLPLGNYFFLCKIICESSILSWHSPECFIDSIGISGGR